MVLIALLLVKFICYMQALDKDGNPLCIHCQHVYESRLISNETLKNNPWYTRFCSKKCMDEYWVCRFCNIYDIKTVTHFYHLNAAVKLYR